MNVHKSGDRTVGVVEIDFEVPAAATKEEVRSARKLLGLTQDQFARLFEVTEYTVWRWENGKRQMDEIQTRHLRRISEESLFAGGDDSTDPVSGTDAD